jgi:ABC-type lipoprotein export system ATPase subunit
MKNLIRLEGLHKRYGGAQVLRGIRLEVSAGEIVAIMGPSGCGKSTLLHVLGLLLTPDQGRYEVLGRDLFGLDHREKARFRLRFFGFILQSCNVFAHTTVAENVEYPLIYAGVPRRERLGRVRRLLAQVNLAASENERSNTLSGGEQQRVAIARALVNDPRILFADEPTGQLDHTHTEHLMRHFREVTDRMQLGMVIVTHDPQVAAHCDVVHALRDGLLIPGGKAEPAAQAKAGAGGGG